jgi:hypothetical protein
LQHESLTPVDVQEYLRRMAGIDVSLDEAAAIIPNIEANRALLANLDRFDVQEARPATMLDPAGAAVAPGGA